VSSGGERKRHRSMPRYFTLPTLAGRRTRAGPGSALAATDFLNLNDRFGNSGLVSAALNDAGALRGGRAMLQIDAPRHATRSKPESRRSAVNRKRLAMLIAVCAYIGFGYVAFHVGHAMTADHDVADWVVGCLAFPLSAPLLIALDWIDKHF
jgi:hypothetical protein